MLYPEKSILYPEKSFCIPKKVFCIPQKVFCIPEKVFVSQKKFFVSQNKHHLRGTLHPQKSILYTQKSAPEGLWSVMFRRIIARTIAKQCVVAAEKATAPFQYALRTRAGCECVSHVLQTLVSRNAMLKGLLTMEGGDRVLPFVRLFYEDPSTFMWEDDLGGIHSVLQGEGGEQGDPLMPMLFSLGQHAALMAGRRQIVRGGTVARVLGQFVHRHHSRPDSGSTQHSA